jgi:hypothetical protein
MVISVFIHENQFYPYGSDRFRSAHLASLAGFSSRRQALPLFGDSSRSSKSANNALYYASLDGALEFGAPQSIVSRWTVLGQPFYDITPDGRKILLDRVSQQVSQSVTVVTNFTALLNK